MTSLTIALLVTAFLVQEQSTPDHGVPPEVSREAQAQRAVELAREALAQVESERGPSHPDTARALTALAGALEGVMDYAAALPLYERALSIREAALGPDHLDTMSSLNDLAFLRSTLGDNREARRLFERALAICEEVLGPDHPDTATLLNNLASTCCFVGDFAAARPLHERALAIREAVLGPQHPDTALSLNNLAFLRKAMGDYPAARPLMERALAIRESQQGSEHPDTAVCIENLASVLEGLGDYAAARPLYERALSIREAHLGPEHPLTATSLNNLGSLLLSLGDPAAARPLFERSLAIRESRLGPTHPDTAVSLNNLGAALWALGELAAARPLYERSLSIREARLGPDDPATAAGQCNLASLLWSLREVDAARTQLERALVTFESRLGPDHPSTATILHNLASILWATGDLEAARPRFERALSIRESRLGPEHPDTAMSRRGLGQLLLDVEESSPAAELLRRGQTSRRDHLYKILGTRTREESLRYLEQQLDYENLVLSLPRILPGAEAESAALGTLLEWKGQVGRVARTLNRLRGTSREVRALSEQLSERQALLVRLAYDTDLEAAARAARIAELRAEARTLELALRARAGVGAVEDADVRTIAESLPDHAACVTFFVHPVYVPARHHEDGRVEPGHWTEPHLVAWAFRRDAAVVSMDLGLADAREQEIQAFLSSLESDRGVKPSAAQLSAGAILRRSLWDPLVGPLGDASLILLSHDRFTANLPFEVLQDGDGRFLLEDRSFACLHDLQSIAGLGSEASPDRQSLLCVGAVDFNGHDEPDDPAASPDRGGVAAPTERWQFWRFLDRTGAEVATIRDLHRAFVPDGVQTVLNGAEASEERVLAAMPDASLVHVATHGYFMPAGLPSMWRAAREEAALRRGGGSAPLQENLLPADRELTGYLPEVLSGLVLAGANLPPSEDRLDGYLTAADLEWMDLSHVDLITLSACETGLGRAESGEGMTGFRSTLLRAGAKTVITSLWQVPDDSTERLMTRFYENLLRHEMGKLEALREAQLWMLRENRRLHNGDGRPHTWGAFVVSGDWR